MAEHPLVPLLHCLRKDGSLVDDEAHKRAVTPGVESQQIAAGYVDGTGVHTPATPMRPIVRGEARSHVERMGYSSQVLLRYSRWSTGATDVSLASAFAHWYGSSELGPGGESLAEDPTTAALDRPVAPRGDWTCGQGRTSVAPVLGQQDKESRARDILTRIPTGFPLEGKKGYNEW